MWISGRIGISLFHSFPRVTLYLKSDRNESLVALEVKSNYSKLLMLLCTKKR